MKISRFSEPQIIGILKQSDSGVPVAELCRQHGMSSAAFYKWRSKYGGMDVSMMSDLNAGRWPGMRSCGGALALPWLVGRSA